MNLKRYSWENKGCLCRNCPSFSLVPFPFISLHPSFLIEMVKWMHKFCQMEKWKMSYASVMYLCVNEAKAEIWFQIKGEQKFGLQYERKGGKLRPLFFVWWWSLSNYLFYFHEFTNDRHLSETNCGGKDLESVSSVNCGIYTLLVYF